MNRRPKPLIMIADDDPTVRLLAEQALGESAGFEFVGYSDGGALLEGLEHRTPDIVLLDVQMPHVDGLEACRTIRARKATQHIPVVMITGSDDPESVNRAYEVGATDFVSKPLPWIVLPHRIRYVLRASQAFRDVQGAERRIRSMLQGIPDLMLIIDRDGNIIDDFQKHSHGSDRGLPKVLGQPLEALLPGRVANEVRESLEAALDSREILASEHCSAEGQEHFEARLIPQEERTCLLVLRDITQRRESEARIHQLAYYDELTGLPNRRQFRKELDRVLQTASRAETKVAILYIDLDRFKRINDTLGHSVGDMLLKSVAKRLAGCIRPADYVARGEASDPSELQLARLGGDEFIMLLVDIEDEQQIEQIATRIRSALTEPVKYDGYQFVVTPSIGISLYPDDGDDIETLLMNADTALHQAKASGRNDYRFYTSTMNARSLERLDLEAAVRHAIESESFSLHYQPKVDAATWKVVGVEALIRWHDPERGSIPPDEFIPLAEESGLIEPLGEWVVREACSQLKRWQGTALDRLTIAVNISSDQFRRSNIADFVLKTVWNAGIPANRLELEITESLLMQDIERTIVSLQSLKDSGIRLSVDDFGTGYSSLSYLKRFPLNSLKIDRSFITSLHEDRDDAAICAAIIAIGRELGLTVVAEGVERDDHVEFLRGHGCDQIQGFLYCKPLPVDGLEEFLAEAPEYLESV